MQSITVLNPQNWLLMQFEKAQIYCNAMELLVAEEVERQLEQIPPQLIADVNKIEATAYALNCLPALYATTEKGLQWQKLRGKNELGAQVVEAVRQGLAATYYNHQQPSTPLKPTAPEIPNAAKVALQGLRSLLQTENLSWHNVVDAVERALLRNEN